MRNPIIALASFGCIACAAKDARVDSAVSRDSSIVAGPPAAPSTQPAASAIPKPVPVAKSPVTRTSAASNETRTDSVRGIVSVVGTSFDKHVMIAEGGTRKRIEVIGSLSSLIGHLAGADVAANGTVSGTQLAATKFVVRSVDGQPAIDGILRTEGGSLFIVTAEGIRTRITAPPPPLLGNEGARVWITGDPTKSVSSFGFIDPPR